MTTSPARAASALLERERAEALALIDQLTEQLQQFVSASESSNADDEHDPEGATIAYERQQVAALLDATYDRVREVEEARDRVAAGTFGICESCGQQIAGARLEARPFARTCIECAR